MRLILVRHYKTQFNVSGRIMGWGDSPPADDWQQDMQFVTQVLQQRSIHLDQVYSSVLARAQHTAEYFAQQFAVADVHLAPQLNEINYGTLYGKPKAWAATHYPLHKKDPDFIYPEGESFNQLLLRSVGFVKALAQSGGAQTVLCVAHSGVVRALLSHFLDLNYSDHLRCKVTHRYIGLLDFDGPCCASYDEWGTPSGFVTEGTLALPYSRKIA